MSETGVSPPAMSSVVDDLRKRELDLREREIAARERGIKAKEAELSKSPWLNPLVIGLFGAALGLIGNSVVALLNNQNSQTVERFRAQSNLVIDSIKTDQQNACKNLVFLVNLKLLDDTERAIKQVCQDQPQQAPSLGSVNVISGPIPPLVQGGAPVGTKFQYVAKRPDDLDCLGEYVKVSTTEWNERPATENPPACTVDAVIFHFTERKSDDPNYFLLYDSSRNLFARFRDTPRDQVSPTDWRLVFNQSWNVSHLVKRIN